MLLEEKLKSYSESDRTCNFFNYNEDSKRVVYISPFERIHFTSLPQIFGEFPAWGGKTNPVLSQ